MTGTNRWRRRIIRWLTVLLVLALLANPELSHLGFLVDAAGLDTLLLLVELQVLVSLGLVYQRSLRRPWHAACAMTRAGLARLRVRRWPGAFDGYLIRNAGPFGQWSYVHCRCAASALVSRFAR